MKVVSMATAHSTETTAKLLKANCLETGTRWVMCANLCVYQMCVYGVGCVVCYSRETGCFQGTTDLSSLCMSELVSPLENYNRWVCTH